MGLKIFVFLLFMSFICLGGMAGADGVKIIGNKSVPFSELSREDVTKIFLYKQVEWPDKSKISFVILKDGAVHDSFVRLYLRRSPQQYSRYWKMMLFTGKGIMPKIFESDNEIVRFVASTDGAIGYVSMETPVENVKIISVR